MTERAAWVIHCKLYENAMWGVPMLVTEYNRYMRLQRYILTRRARAFQTMLQEAQRACTIP